MTIPVRPWPFAFLLVGSILPPAALAQSGSQQIHIWASPHGRFSSPLPPSLNNGYLYRNDEQISPQLCGHRNPQVSIVRLSVASPDRIVAGCGDGEVRVSTDGGKTWAASLGASSRDRLEGLTATRAPDEIVVTYTTYTMTSTDFGRSWRGAARDTSLAVRRLGLPRLVALGPTGDSTSSPGAEPVTALPRSQDDTPSASPDSPPSRTQVDVPWAVAQSDRWALDQLFFKHYPPDLLLAGTDGRAILWVFVSERGRPVRAIVEKSTGNSRLDRAAINLVMDVVYRPAMVQGRPVGSWRTITIPFDSKHGLRTATYVYAEQERPDLLVQAFELLSQRTALDTADRRRYSLYLSLLVDTLLFQRRFDEVSPLIQRAYSLRVSADQPHIRRRESWLRLATGVPITSTWLARGVRIPRLEPATIDRLAAQVTSINEMMQSSNRAANLKHFISFNRENLTLRVEVRQGRSLSATEAHLFALRRPAQVRVDKQIPHLASTHLRCAEVLGDCAYNEQEGKAFSTSGFFSIWLGNEVRAQDYANKVDDLLRIAYGEQPVYATQGSVWTEPESGMESAPPVRPRSVLELLGAAASMVSDSLAVQQSRIERETQEFIERAERQSRQALPRPVGGTSRAGSGGTDRERPSGIPGGNPPRPFPNQGLGGVTPPPAPPAPTTEPEAERDAARLPRGPVTPPSPAPPDSSFGDQLRAANHRVVEEFRRAARVAHFQVFVTTEVCRGRNVASVSLLTEGAIVERRGGSGIPYYITGAWFGTELPRAIGGLEAPNDRTRGASTGGWPAGSSQCAWNFTVTYDTRRHSNGPPVDFTWNLSFGDPDYTGQRYFNGRYTIRVQHGGRYLWRGNQ